MSLGNTETGTLVIMTDENATVDVSEPCTAGVVRYFPTPGAPAVINICRTAQYRGSGPDPGYIIGLGRVDAQVPSLHVVFKVNHPGFPPPVPGPPNASDDAFLVLPKNPDRRGNAYWSLGHRGAVGQRSRWLATADSALELNFKDCTGATAPPQDLAAGEVFQVACNTAATLKDGTGSRINSTGGENFGFISGATCADVPVGTTSCDVLAEMMPGEGWWGTEYFVTEYNKNPSGVKGDLIRMVSTAAANVANFTPATGGDIKTEGSSGHACNSAIGHTFTNAGDWCDILVEGGATITAGSAIVVGQLMKGVTDAGVGDPSLSLVLPTDRFRCG